MVKSGTETMLPRQVSRRSVSEKNDRDRAVRRAAWEVGGAGGEKGEEGEGRLSASSSAAGHMDGVTLVQQRPHRAACWLWECWRAGTDGTGASVENGLHCFHATQSPLISFLSSLFFPFLDSRLR